MHLMSNIDPDHRYAKISLNNGLFTLDKYGTTNIMEAPQLVTKGRVFAQ